MSVFMGNLRNILGKCQEAADGKLSEEEQIALASRVRGVFMSMPMFKEVIRLAESKDWYAVEGALSNYIDMQEASGYSTNITQNATATATSTAAAAASAYVDAIIGIDSLPTLSQEDKDELEKLMLDVKSAKDESMLKHAAKVLVDKTIEKGVDTFPYAFPVIVDAARRILGM